MGEHLFNDIRNGEITAKYYSLKLIKKPEDPQYDHKELKIGKSYTIAEKYSRDWKDLYYVELSKSAIALPKDCFEKLPEIKKEQPKQSRILENVKEQYKDEFPAIEYINEDIAKKINNLNKRNGKPLSISEIKETYRDIGKSINDSYYQINPDNVLKKEFNELSDIVRDLNLSKMTYDHYEHDKVKSLEKSMHTEIEL